MRTTMLILLTVLALVAQSPNDPPGTTPPSDLDRCDNFHNTDPVHKCDCSKTRCELPNPDGTMPEQIESPRCKVFCKPEHCHCISSCTS